MGKHRRNGMIHGFARALATAALLVSMAAASS